MVGLEVTILFAGLGSTIYACNGFPRRGPDASDSIKDLRREAEAFQVSPCLVRGGTLPGVNHCLLGAPSAKSEYSVVFWRDSHAAQFAPAIDDIGHHLGLTAREITKAGCPPITGVDFFPVANDRRECRAFNDAVLRSVLADGHIQVVILSARWDSIVNGTYFLTDNGSREDSEKLFVESLQKMLTSLVWSGRRVILVTQVPLPPENLIGCITWAQFNHGDERACEITNQAKHRETEARVNEALLKVVTGLQPNVQIVRPFSSLCGPLGCNVRAAGQLLYMDDVHLSPDGARLVIGDLERSISSQVTAATKSRNLVTSN